MKKCIRLSLATILSFLVFNCLTVTEGKAQILSKILKQMDNHQKSLSSLNSKVLMTKYNAQLQESDVAKGTMIYARTAKNPLSSRVDWTNPIVESLILVNDQFILYRPRLKQAIIGKIDKSKKSDRIINALSFLSMSKKEIRTNYIIMYDRTEKVGDSLTWHLIITPKKADLYKAAELWVDGSGMPIQAKVLENNKDSTTVLLSDFKKNSPINPSIFQFNVPKETKILKASADACSCFKPFNVKDAVANQSDVIFSGILIVTNGADYTFTTERAWKGAVNNIMVVKNLALDDSCSIKMQIGRRYVVFARQIKVKDQIITSLMPCNLTDDAGSESGKKVIKELGIGKLVKNISPVKKQLPVKKSEKRRS